MASKFSANALPSMVRSMYGKRLTESDFDTLVSCRGVAEVADRLRSTPDYADVFASVTIGDIHRLQLEALLDNLVEERLARISSFEKLMGHEFYKYYICTHDCRLIVSCLRICLGGAASRNVFSMPSFYGRNTRVDAIALAKAESFDDVLAALKGSEYGSALRARENEIRSGGILHAELALDDFADSKLADIAGSFGCDEKSSELFKTKSDLTRLTRLCRAIRLRLDDPILSAALMSGGLTLLSDRQRRRLAVSADTDDFFAKLSQTVYAPLAGAGSASSFGSACDRFLYEKSRGRLHFSTDPIETVFAYMNILENEVRNVVLVSEGVRYGLSPENIKQMIIL